MKRFYSAESPGVAAEPLGLATGLPVLAVCEAAIECGVDEILLYDGHFAGEAEFNVILEQLPGNVRTFDTPSREFDWRRIRGQADSNPFLEAYRFLFPAIIKPPYLI